MSLEVLLDTNVISELSKPAPNAAVLEWLSTIHTPRLSVITLGELRRGFHLMPIGRKKQEIEARVDRYLLGPKIVFLPVTDQIANRWGELSALRQRSGRPLHVPDGLIAATALEHDLTLVTRNSKDFAGLGLRLFNPWQEHHEP